MQWYESVITAFPFWIIKLRCHRTVSETIETQTQQGERGQTTDSMKLPQVIYAVVPVCPHSQNTHTHKDTHTQ